MKSIFQKLSVVRQITDKVVVKPGITTLVSDAGDCICNIDVSDVGDFEEFGISELSKIMSIFQIFDDNDTFNIDVTDNINMTNGKNSASIIKADINILKPQNIDSDIIERTYQIHPDVCCDIDVKKIIELKKAISILKDANCLEFDVNNNRLIIKISYRNRFEQNNDTFSIEIPILCSIHFKFGISIESFCRIPNLDYELRLVHDNEKNLTKTLLVTKDKIFKIGLASIKD